MDSLSERSEQSLYTEGWEWHGPARRRLVERPWGEVWATPAERWGTSSTNLGDVTSTPAMRALLHPLAKGAPWIGWIPWTKGLFVLPYGLPGHVQLLKAGTKETLDPADIDERGQPRVPCEYNRFAGGIRADAVASRHCLCFEIDPTKEALARFPLAELIERQFRDIVSAGLNPILTYSGGKSLHGLIRLPDDAPSMSLAVYMEYQARLAAALPDADHSLVASLHKVRTPGATGFGRDQRCLHLPGPTSLEELDRVLPPLRAVPEQLHARVLRARAAESGEAPRKDSTETKRRCAPGFTPDPRARNPEGRRRNTGYVFTLETLAHHQHRGPQTVRVLLDEIVDAGERCRIKCPVHETKSFGASLFRFHDGTPAISCAKCNATWPCTPLHREDAISLKLAFEEIIGREDRTYEAIPRASSLEPPREDLPAGLGHYPWFSVTQQSPGYLPRESISSWGLGCLLQQTSALLAIVAPHGAGKTEVSKWTSDAAQAAGFSFQGIVPYASLAATMANRLGVLCYEDVMGEEAADTATLVTTIDSAYKYGHADVLVIDEADRVLHQIATAATIKAMAGRVLFDLAERMAAARVVILMSADLTGATVAAYDRILRTGGHTPPPAALVYQDAIQMDRRFRFLAAEQELLWHVQEAARQGERFFLPCAYQQAAEVAEELIASCTSLPVLRIDSTTSGEPHVRAALEDPNNPKGGWRVAPDGRPYAGVIASPTACVGLSYDVPDDIQRVFALAGPHGPDARGLLQLCARVRNPVHPEVLCYVNPRRQPGDPRPAIHKARAKAKAASARRSVSDAGGTVDDHTGDRWDALHLDLWAEARAAREQDQANFAYSLREALRAQKRPFSMPDDPEEESESLPQPSEEALSAIAEEQREGRRTVKEREEQGILRAAKIDREEADRRRTSYRLTREQQLELRRYEICETYDIGTTPGLELGRALVHADTPAYRRRMRRLATGYALLQGYMVEAATPAARALTRGITARVGESFKAVEAILAHLEDVWGISREDLLYGEAEIDTREVESRMWLEVRVEGDGSFDLWVDRAVRPLADVLGFRVRADLREKPVAWLQELFRALGLRLVRPKDGPHQPRLVGGGRTRVRVLDVDEREVSKLRADAFYHRLGEVAQPTESPEDSKNHGLCQGRPGWRHAEELTFVMWPPLIRLPGQVPPPGFPGGPSLCPAAPPQGGDGGDGGGRDGPLPAN